MLFEKTVLVSEILSHQKPLLKPFVVYGFDTISLGSTKFKNGVYIGIPSNYFYEFKSDINRDSILIRNKKIDWDSSQGKLLEEALVLTENEKIFAIIKAILESDNYKITLDSVYPFMTMLLVYTSANKLNSKLKLLARPFIVRAVIYTLLSVFGYGLYSFCKDFTQVQIESEIDKQLAEMGPEFARAGVEYYAKLLQKNIAIRELTNDNEYSSKGNFNYLLRQRSMPLTLRKKFFELKAQEYADQKI